MLCRFQFATLQHDPNWPEDVPKVDAVGGHDAADALRHLVATKARRLVERKLTGGEVEFRLPWVEGARLTGQAHRLALHIVGTQSPYGDN